VSRTASTYPPGGTTTVSTTGNRIDAQRSLLRNGNFSISVLLLRFDTSSLPDDAVITAARLEVHVATTSNSDTRRLVGEFYPATNWPISAGAYTATAPAVNTALDVSIGALTTGQVDSIPLDQALSNQQISRTAATGLRLHVSGGQPTGANDVEIGAQDHSHLADPCLVVDYVGP